MQINYDQTRQIWPLQITAEEYGDAWMMLEALTELERFPPGARPCWDMEPVDEWERRTR